MESNRNYKYKSNGSETIVIGMLGVAFVTLKLTGFIDWSWWWVTAPFWAMVVMPLITMSIVLILMGIGSFSVILFGAFRDRFKRKK